MSIYIIPAFLLLLIITYLIVDYFKSKKMEKQLLSNILTKKISFENISISEPDGDGYQRLEVFIKNEFKDQRKQLAGHFDILETTKILEDAGFIVSGKFIQ